jgi:hypothetical protein
MNEMKRVFDAASLLLRRVPANQPNVRHQMWLSTSETHYKATQGVGLFEFGI